MQINTRELNGIFQVECHTLCRRLLWIIFASISLSIIAFGVWAVKVNLFDLSQNAGLKYFEIVFVIFLFFVVPIVTFIVGLVKSFKKAGMYFVGVRVADKDIEIGRFFLNVNPVSPKKIWDNETIVDDRLGEWKQIRSCNNNSINILIVLNKRYESSQQYLFERVIFSSRNECLFQMFGHDRSGIHWNDIFALSQGSLHLLGNDDGIRPDDLLSFRERTANIISKWKLSFALTCSLKIIPSLANLDNVLAFGVLGGANPQRDKSIDNCEHEEKIYDSLSL